MNGTEQRNARMSLANDILRRAGSTNIISSRQQPTTTRPVKALRTRAYKKPVVRPDAPHIPGVSWSQGNNRWAAFFYDGSTVIRVGEFETQERAHVALRLYKYWRKLGLKDIPNKPTIRTYAQRIGFI